MNRILVFSQNGRDISLPIAESRTRDSALLMRPSVAAPSRGVRAKLRDLLCPCKHMISRRLGPLFTFFTPFLSCKGLVSRRLQQNHGLINFRSEVRFESQGQSVSRKGRSFRTGNRREAGRPRQKPAILSGLVPGCPGLSRLVPPCPALSRLVPGMDFFGKKRDRHLQVRISDCGISKHGTARAGRRRSVPEKRAERANPADGDA
jgi:hypothetical protein